MKVMKQPVGRRAQLALAAVLLAVVLLPSHASASPSNDPKYRTEVEGPHGTRIVLMRDPHDPFAWYYIPAELRIAEDEVGRPKFRWTETVLKQQRFAILQLAVTGQPDTESEARMRAAAVAWFEKERAENLNTVVPTPNQIKLSPVGPLRMSQMNAVVFRNGLVDLILSGGCQSMNTAPASLPAVDSASNVSGSSAAGDATSVHTVRPSLNVTGQATSLPGVSDLQQLTWVQYEISGAGVSIVKDLLTGKGNGGLILLFTGQYRAFSPEYSVSVSLDVHAFQSFFRERKEETSGWNFFGLIGSCTHSVRDYIESRSELKKALQIERIGGGALTPADWDKIESRLYDFVTKNVFEVSNAKSDAAAPQITLGSFADVGGIVSALTGVPGLSLPLGWQEATGNLEVRATSTTDYHATAVWRGRDIEWTPLTVYANVSLSRYDQSIREELFGQPLVITEPRTVNVVLPSGSHELLGGIDCVISARDSQRGQARILARIFRGSDGWVQSGPNQNGNVVMHPRGALVVLDDATALDSIQASVRIALPPANGASNNLTPVYEVAQVADTDGNISFEGSLPFRECRLVLDELSEVCPKATATASIKVLSMDSKGRALGGEGWSRPVPIRFPVLDQGQTRHSQLIAGTVQAIEVRGGGYFHDSFTGRTPLTHLPVRGDWVIAQQELLNLSGGSLLAIEPQAFGIRRLGISFNSLLRQQTTQRCEIRLTTSEEAVCQIFVRIEGGQLLDEATGKPLPDGVCWLTTRHVPTEISGVIVGEGGDRPVVLDAETFQSWSEADDAILFVD